MVCIQGGTFCSPCADASAAPSPAAAAPARPALRARKARRSLSGCPGSGRTAGVRELRRVVCMTPPWLEAKTARDRSPLVMLFGDASSGAMQDENHTSKPEEALRVFDQYFPAGRRVRGPLAEQVEQLDRADLVSEREVRVIAAPDDAVGNRLDQRARHRGGVGEARGNRHAVGTGELDPPRSFPRRNSMNC